MTEYEPEPVDTDDGTDGDDGEAAGTGPEDRIRAVLAEVGWPDGISAGWLGEDVKVTYRSFA